MININMVYGEGAVPGEVYLIKEWPEDEDIVADGIGHIAGLRTDNGWKLLLSHGELVDVGRVCGRSEYPLRFYECDPAEQLKEKTDPKCKECNHYKPFLDKKPYGLCKKKSPTTIEGEAIWPIVPETEGCGEFEKTV